MPDRARKHSDGDQQHDGSPDSTKTMGNQEDGERRNVLRKKKVFIEVNLRIWRFVEDNLKIWGSLPSLSTNSSNPGRVIVFRDNLL